MIKEICFNIFLHSSTKTILNLSLIDKQFNEMSKNNYFWITKFKKSSCKTLIEWIDLYHHDTIYRMVENIQLPLCNFYNDMVYRSLIIDPNDTELSYILPYQHVEVNKLHYFYISFYETNEWLLDIISSAPRYRYVINKNKVIHYLKMIYRYFDVDVSINPYNENIYLTIK